MINKAIVQGRLTRNPELRMTSSDIPVCSFTVAWNESYKDNGKTLYLDCVAWRSSAEFVSKYFSKGSQILVEGPLSTRKWQDKDGNNRSVVELTVDRVHFCGDKHESSGAMPEVAADNDEAIPRQPANNSNKYDYKPSEKPVATENGFAILAEPDEGELPF